MKEQQIADAEVVKETLAVGPHTPENVQQSKVTPAQARVEAVADLIKVAMPRAGTLQLTKEESAALLADFPDDCFQPGAGGKEHLIYIEHAALRDRFNQVLGLGQWAIIVRETWNEEFETKGSGGKPPQKGTRVYARAMLLVRGCYVAEAVGDMDYYPSNAAQNYGDAFEGAKSAAFRRCAKEFGVGLQAWRKDFAAGWKERRYSRLEKQHEAKLQPAEPTPKANGDKPLKARIEALASWLTEQLGPDAACAAPYLRTHTTDGGEKSSALLPNEDLKDLTEMALTGIRADPKGFLARLKAFAKAQDQIPGAEVPEKKIEVPRDADAGREQDIDWWKSVAIHFGQNQGTLLGDLEVKTIYGWWANWEAGESDKDAELRRALDAAGAKYQFK